MIVRQIKKEDAMIGLDRLMQIPGVLVAEQFDSNGKILRSEGDLSDDMIQLAALIAAKQNKTLVEETNNLEKIGGINWKGLNGWAFWSGKYTLCVMNNTGLIVETTKVNFNDIIVNLIGDGPTGPKQMNY
jgi:roadblock/LC7 domain-containing protein